MILRCENGEEKGSEDDVEQLEDEEDDPQGEAARFQLERIFFAFLKRNFR